MAFSPADYASDTSSSGSSVDWGKILNALLTGGTAYASAKQNNKAAEQMAKPQVQSTFNLHTPYMNPQLQEIMPFIMSEAQKVYQKRMGLTGVEAGDFSSIAQKLSGMSADQWLKDAGSMGGSGFNSGQGGSSSGSPAPSYGSSSSTSSSSGDDAYTKGGVFDTGKFSDGSRKFDENPGYGTSANEDLLANVRGKNALDLSTVDWSKIAAGAGGALGGIFGSFLGPIGGLAGEAAGKKLGGMVGQHDPNDLSNMIGSFNNRNENSDIQAAWEAYQRQGGGSLSNFMNSSGGGSRYGNIGTGSGGGGDIWGDLFSY